jgi:molybdate transport system substrate-binding protein
MKYLSQLSIISALLTALNISAAAQDHHFDPPWNTPPQSSVLFTVPGIDNVPDLFGDINDPQLVIFFAGNQFMCVDDLLTEFKKAYPQYQRVFAETLPPGILAKQIAGGSVTIGNMRITLKPDVFTAGKGLIDQMADSFTSTAPYAFNNLAIMVQKGNPKKVKGFTDLGKPEIRVSMPNPAWEGIGKLIEKAYVIAGTETLRKTIMVDKVNDGSTYLTQIHHRESPMRILYNQADAAPVWYSEAYYQTLIGHPTELVEIPASQNVSETYTVGQLKAAPHPEAAKDFMNFLTSPTAKAIYRKYGFTTK